MTNGRIKTYGGKILRADGMVATADDCCCGGECTGDCCSCDASEFHIDVTFTGTLSAYDGTYTATSRSTPVGSTCSFYFDSSCPIGTIEFLLHGGTTLAMRVIPHAVSGWPFYTYDTDDDIENPVCPGEYSPTPSWDSSDMNEKEYVATFYMH